MNPQHTSGNRVRSWVFRARAAAVVALSLVMASLGVSAVSTPAAADDAAIDTLIAAAHAGDASAIDALDDLGIMVDLTDDAADEDIVAEEPIVEEPSVDESASDDDAVADVPVEAKPAPADVVTDVVEADTAEPATSDEVTADANAPPAAQTTQETAVDDEADAADDVVDIVPTNTGFTWWPWPGVPYTVHDDGFGTNDSSWFHPSSSEQGSQSPNNGPRTSQDDWDLGTIKVGNELRNGEQFSLIAFNRANHTGALAFAVELNQAMSGRQVGDVVFWFNTPSGGATPTLHTARVWTGSGWLNLANASQFATGFAGPVPTQTGLSVNLTGLMLAQPGANVCAGGFISASLRTSNSGLQSGNWSLVDNAGPIPVITPAPCEARVQITKVERPWDAANGAASTETRPGPGWTFTATEQSPGFPVVPPGSGTVTTGSNGQAPELVLRANHQNNTASMTVVETARDGWALESAQCTPAAAAVNLQNGSFRLTDIRIGTVVRCTVTNLATEPEPQPLQTSLGAPTATYSVDFGYTMDKSVVNNTDAEGDMPVFIVGPDGTVTLTYRLVVDATRTQTDVDVAVPVTVTNPNTHRDMTLDLDEVQAIVAGENVALTSVTVGDETGTLSGTLTIPANGSATLVFSGTLTGVDSASSPLAVQITGLGEPIEGSVTVPAATPANTGITVSDAFREADRVVAGGFGAHREFSVLDEEGCEEWIGDLRYCRQWVFEYDATLSVGSDADAALITNDATVTWPGGSDTDSVPVQVVQQWLQVEKAWNVLIGGTSVTFGDALVRSWADMDTAARAAAAGDLNIEVSVADAILSNLSATLVLNGQAPQPFPATDVRVRQDDVVLFENSVMTPPTCHFQSAEIEDISEDNAGTWPLATFSVFGFAGTLPWNGEHAIGSNQVTSLVITNTVECPDIERNVTIDKQWVILDVNGDVVEELPHADLVEWLEDNNLDTDTLDAQLVIDDEPAGWGVQTIPGVGFGGVSLDVTETVTAEAPLTFVGATYRVGSDVSERTHGQEPEFSLDIPRLGDVADVVVTNYVTLNPVVLGSVAGQATLNIDHEWAVTKTVDTAVGEVLPGAAEGAPFVFTLAVTAQRVVPEHVTITGTVEVVNPTNTTLPGDAVSITAAGADATPVDWPEQLAPGTTDVEFSVTLPFAYVEAAESLPIVVTLGDATVNGDVTVTSVEMNATATLTDTFPEFGTAHNDPEGRVELAFSGQPEGGWTFPYTAERGAGQEDGESVTYRNIAMVQPGDHPPVDLDNHDDPRWDYEDITVSTPEVAPVYPLPEPTPTPTPQPPTGEDTPGDTGVIDGDDDQGMGDTGDTGDGDLSDVELGATDAGNDSEVDLDGSTVTEAARRAPVRIAGLPVTGVTVGVFLGLVVVLLGSGIAVRVAGKRRDDDTDEAAGTI